MENRFYQSKVFRKTHMELAVGGKGLQVSRLGEEAATACHGETCLSERNCYVVTMHDARGRKKYHTEELLCDARRRYCTSLCTRSRSTHFLCTRLTWWHLGCDSATFPSTHLP